MLDIRTELDLQRLIGETESMILEFKAPNDFRAWPQGKQNAKEMLSKEVSAFANTYGGQIIIGVNETKEHRAESFAGVDPRSPSIETIQRIIESNVHPRLEGIRYVSIPLTGNNESLVAYVISVPEGRTAYQASDKRYYGRSEYESVPLEDQLIRYKMIRERLAEAQIKITDIDVETARDEYMQRLGNEHRRNTEELEFTPRAVRERLEAPARDYDVYSFSMIIENTGATTIHDCLLQVDFVGLPLGARLSPGLPSEHRRLFRFGRHTVNSLGTPGAPITVATDNKLFPTQEQEFPESHLVLMVPATADVQNVLLHWKLYLDDCPSWSGTIALGGMLLPKGAQ